MKNLKNYQKIDLLTFFPFCILMSGAISVFLFLSIVKLINPQFSPSYAPETGESMTDATKVGMANPGAVYCQDMGYEFQIVNTDQGQDGICVFDSDENCPAWDFLNGKCGTEYSYCAMHGYDQMIKDDGLNAFSRVYAVCVRRSDGLEVGAVADLSGLNEKAVKAGYPQTTKLAPPKSSQENPDLLFSDPVTLPTSLDWRSRDGSDWMTEVKNQGGCGSCWSFSAIGVSEAVTNIAANNPNLDLDLSEEYLVSDCHSAYLYQNCCGGWSDTALEFIRTSGVTDEDCFPYIDDTSCTCTNAPTCDANCTYKTDGNCSDSTCSNRCNDWESRRTYISETGWIDDTVTAIKQALITYGPLSALFGIGDDYGGYWDGDIYRCADDIGINHAIVITGYSDADQAWIVKNSWGSDWNGDGYLKIGYGECLIEVNVYYAVGESRKFIVRDNNGTDVASFNEQGDVILSGSCSAQASCVAPSPSFIIQNNAGSTVAYVDDNGNLCLESGDCTDQSANCNAPQGDAFIIKNENGTNVSYIDQTGDLCLTGDLITGN